MRLAPAIPPAHRASWSYAAVGIYLALCFVSFPGDWLLTLAATYLFIDTRHDLYRDCPDPAIKRKYVTLRLGYYGFFAFSLLGLPLLTLLPLATQSTAVGYLLIPCTTGLLYLVPATLYLAILDRRISARRRPPVAQ